MGLVKSETDDKEITQFILKIGEFLKNHKESTKSAISSICR
jgi:hypothetical protein